MGLTPDEVFAGETLPFFGVSGDGPAGILRPGETASQTIYFQSPASSGDPYDFQLQVVTADDPQPIDWIAVQLLISDAYVSAPNFQAIFARLQTDIGTTWGDYVKTLAHDATLMPAGTLLGSNTNIRDLLNLSVIQASAEVSSSISGTLQAQDPSVAIAGQTVYAVDSTNFDFNTAEGTSLTDGTFVIDQVDTGTYTLSTDGVILNSPTSVTVASGESITGVNLDVSNGAIVSGYLVTADTGAQLRGRSSRPSGTTAAPTLCRSSTATSTCSRAWSRPTTPSWPTPPERPDGPLQCGRRHR